jgi:NADPH-dependent curcumin reductase CurA
MATDARGVLDYYMRKLMEAAERADPVEVGKLRIQVAIWEVLAPRSPDHRPGDHDHVVGEAGIGREEN